MVLSVKPNRTHLADKSSGQMPLTDSLDAFDSWMEEITKKPQLCQVYNSLLDNVLMLGTSHLEGRGTCLWTRTRGRQRGLRSQ